MLHIPQIPSITGTSPSDCLVSFFNRLLSLFRGYSQCIRGPTNNSIIFLFCFADKKKLQLRFCNFSPLTFKSQLILPLLLGFFLFFLFVYLFIYLFIYLFFFTLVHIQTLPDIGVYLAVFIGWTAAIRCSILSQYSHKIKKSLILKEGRRLWVVCAYRRGF